MQLGNSRARRGRRVGRRRCIATKIGLLSWDGRARLSHKFEWEREKHYGGRNEER